MSTLPIYCINLLRHPERFAHVQGQAVKAGLAVTRIDAVDGSRPEYRERLDALPARGPTGVMGVGTRACLLSHAHAWQTLLDDPAQPAYGVIFEDDVDLSSDLADVLRSLSQTERRFDLVKLESYGTLQHGALLARDRARDSGQVLALPISNTRWVRRSYQLLAGSAGYLISRGAAQRALQRIARTNLPVDHFLFYPRDLPTSLGLPFAVVTPSVCVQNPCFASSIGAQRNQDPRWQRDLRRAPYEAAQAPGMLRALLGGKASFQRSPFVA